MLSSFKYIVIRFRVVLCVTVNIPQNQSVLEFVLSVAPWWHIGAVAFLVPNIVWLGRNIFKTVVYLRIPYERKRKPKPGEKIDRSKLEKEEKRLKED